MSLLMPGYIKSAEIVADPIQHEWDESVEEDVLLDQPRLTDRLSAISYRGMLAYSLGSMEWTVWRFRQHLPNQTPLQVIEAAWAGTIDWRYLKKFDVPDWADELPEPIGGPLAQAVWLLKEAFIAARDDEPFWQFSASLSEIALRVLKRPELFKDWRRFVIRRLTRMYPIEDGNELGTPVPREALDPQYDYKPDRGNELLVHFLKNLDPSQNAYLSSPKEMLAAGFEGKPYSL